MNAFPTPMPVDFAQESSTLPPAASDSWFVVEGKTTEAPFGEAQANPFADNDDSRYVKIVMCYISSFVISILTNSNLISFFYKCHDTGSVCLGCIVWHNYACVSVLSFNLAHIELIWR